MKTPSRLQKFMARCDKTSSGFMARVDFTKVVRKAVQKNGQQEVKESLTEVVWASVKEGSGKEVARDVVEHEVVKRWLFFGVED
jgi:ribosomal protein S3AE